MAVFLVNVCKFQGCGQEFPSLSGLIQHIEEMHIMSCDVAERQKEDEYPAAVPLSSVLRYFSESEQKGDDACITNDDFSDIDEFVTDEMLSELSSLPCDDLSLLDSPSKTPPQSLPVSSAEASEAEDEGSDSDSNDDEGPWVNNSSNSSDGQEEYSPEFIMKYGSKSSGGIGEEKPYACPVPGCRKRYKNVNGIKYHAKNGHRRDGKAYKAYKCYCGKAYKTAQGLKNHSLAHHGCLPANVPSSASLLNQLRVTRKVTLSPSTMAGLQLVGLKALQALTPAQLARLGSGTAQLVVRPRPKALAVPGKLFQDRLLRGAEQTPMLCDFGDTESPTKAHPVSVDPARRLRLAVPISTLSGVSNKRTASSLLSSQSRKMETELFPEAFDDSDLPPTPTSPACETEYESLFS